MPSMAEAGSIHYSDRTAFNTMDESLFDAAVMPLHWVEIERQSFNTARRFRDDETLTMGVGMVPDRHKPFEPER